MTDTEVILLALSRLPVRADRREALIERTDEFMDRIMLAGIGAGFRPAPSGHRGKPSEITAGISSIAAGLIHIERGFSVIDGARRSTPEAAKARDVELARIQQAALREILSALSSRLPTLIVEADDFAAAMPTYGRSEFANSWNGAFSLAANRVAKLAETASRPDLKAPKAPDEWTDRLIAILGEIYRDATGKRPRAYGLGSDTTNRAWRPPFCRFVAGLWPLWHGPEVAPPSGITMQRALERGQNAIK